MKTRFFPFLSVLSSCAMLAPVAEAQLFKKKPQEDAKPPTSSCIWKVTDEDNTVYLAGSVHLLREEDYPIPPVYLEAYDDSGRVVFEIDMKLIEDPGMQKKVRRMGMLEEGGSLEGVLSKKTWRMLQKYIRNRKLERANIDQMKAGFAFLTINAVESMRLGAKAELGLEQTIYAASKRDVKPTGGLETTEFQLTLFDQLSNEEKDELIRDTLKSVDGMVESLEKMIGAWKVGDGERLDKLMSEEMPIGNKIRDLMLTKRNVAWVPEIEKAIAGKQNVYFLVGAGHLVGSDSVVALLRKKGHTVEQLSYDSIEKLKQASP